MRGGKSRPCAVLAAAAVIVAATAIAAAVAAAVAAKQAIAVTAAAEQQNQNNNPPATIVTHIRNLQKFFSSFVAAHSNIFRRQNYVQIDSGQNFPYNTS